MNEKVSAEKTVKGGGNDKIHRLFEQLLQRLQQCEVGIGIGSRSQIFELHQKIQIALIRKCGSNRGRALRALSYVQ